MISMIFKLLFKKRIKENESKLQDLYTKLRNIKLENKKLRESLDFEKKRFERIKWLLNNRVENNAKCLIEQTKKGLNILTAENIDNENYQIEIFDIDNVDTISRRSLILYASNKEGEIFIDDIQGGSSNGHGEVAMKHLIEFAKKENKGKITGNLSYVDLDHKDRLIVFYEKMGFNVNYESDGNGTLEKKL